MYGNIHYPETSQTLQAIQKRLSVVSYKGINFEKLDWHHKRISEMGCTTTNHMQVTGPSIEASFSRKIGINLITASLWWDMNNF
jgi:hypothetical protein